MGKIAERVFWKLFEAVEAVYAVTGVVLNEIERQAQDHPLSGLNKDGPSASYWTRGLEDYDRHTD